MRSVDLRFFKCFACSPRIEICLLFPDCETYIITIVRIILYTIFFNSFQQCKKSDDDDDNDDDDYDNDSDDNDDDDDDDDNDDG